MPCNPPCRCNARRIQKSSLATEPARLLPTDSVTKVAPPGDQPPLRAGVVGQDDYGLTAYMIRLKPGAVNIGVCCCCLLLFSFKGFQDWILHSCVIYRKRSTQGMPECRWKKGCKGSCHSKSAVQPPLPVQCKEDSKIQPCHRTCQAPRYPSMASAAQKPMEFPFQPLHALLKGSRYRHRCEFAHSLVDIYTACC